MANGSQDGVKPAVLIGGAIALAAVIGAVMVGTSMVGNGPPPAEKIKLSAIEPAPAPPESAELSERVRTYFMKGGVDECMNRHLGKDQRVEGALMIELSPDGKAANAQVKTEPPNGGINLCVQQLFAKGFGFKGDAQKVAYTFSARWGDGGRLALSQNVSSSAVK